MALVKTCSFAMIHFSIAFGIVYLMTGDVWVGGAVALIEPACNTVAFFFHEKLWTEPETRERLFKLTNVFSH